ncbi:MAG: arginine--tRNA ligase [Deltaproteobacteria bacterium]|nr:arginine--tRNA ligase [Deltaproteobacteria bacterium]
MMAASVKKRLVALLGSSLKNCLEKGKFELAAPPPSIEVEMTKDTSHGDYASNIAMVLASQARKPPRQIAELLGEQIEDRDHLLDEVEIAGPGFLNFFIKEHIWTTLLQDVDSLQEQFGTNNIGQGKRVQVEFVSANPTGPLHIGHARGAVIGDVMANILTASGYNVHREYYINDAGNQMNNLGTSVLLRYLELLGKTVEFPDNIYQGDYIRDIAEQIMEKYGDTYVNRDDDEAVRFFTDYAASMILDEIKNDLKAFGIVFDEYFSERELYKDDGVARLLEDLKARGFIYREEDTLWFRTTDFGDEKDRVVVRKNGEPTYFAADIAYHKNKFDRGFDTVIDVWGADHHGYMPRVYGGIQALGFNKDSLKIVLVQLVNLLRDGKPLAMSTRSGEFVTMKEVIDEVGRDAARYNFLMRRSDSHLDFDLELAKKQSNENPVYYVQYAHARICSMIRLAVDRNFSIPRYDETDFSRLTLPEEVMLIKVITRYPEVIEGAALSLEPHRLTFYLNELAGIFHSYYNKHKVVSDDLALSKARLFLVNSIRMVLNNALNLLGVSTPEKM